MRASQHQEEGRANVADSTLQAIAAWGTGGILVVAIIIGLLDPKRITDQLRRDTEAWKALYEKEREAHEHTRREHEKTQELLRLQLKEERDRAIAEVRRGTERTA
jgi:alpha-D-ribose 1-methylphosphonate 5-phosphate C-P lyase